MHRLTRSSIAVVISLVPFACATSASAAEHDPPYEILSRLVGTWNAEIVIHPSKGAEKEIRRNGTTTNEWLLSKKFVRNRESKDGSDTNPANNFMGTALNIWGYDSTKGVYRHWYFDSKGGSASVEGNYDSESKTLTFNGQVGGDITVVNQTRFIDDETQKWTSVARDKDGNVVGHVEIDLKRIK